MKRLWSAGLLCAAVFYACSFGATPCPVGDECSLGQQCIGGVCVAPRSDAGPSGGGSTGGGGAAGGGGEAGGGGTQNGGGGAVTGGGAPTGGGTPSGGGTQPGGGTQSGGGTSNGGGTALSDGGVNPYDCTYASSVLTCVGTDAGLLRDRFALITVVRPPGFTTIPNFTVSSEAASWPTAVTFVGDAVTPKYLVDLSVPALSSLDGRFTIDLQDGGFERATFELPVTRLRWSTQLAPGTTTWRTAPAIDSHGFIYAGSELGLIKVDPRSGTAVAAAVAPGATTSSVHNVAISTGVSTDAGMTEGVFWQRTTATPRASEVLGFDRSGQLLNVSTCAQTSGDNPAFALSRTALRMSVDAVALLQNADGGGIICSYPFKGANSAIIDSITSTEASNLVVQDDRLFVQETNKKITAFEASGANGNWVSLSNSGFTGTAGRPAGLALTGNGTLFAMLTDTNDALVSPIALLSTTPSTLWTTPGVPSSFMPPLGSNTRGSHPAVVISNSQPVALFGSNGRAPPWLRTAPLANSSSFGVVSGLAADAGAGPEVSTVPVIGDNNEVYVVSNEGKLFVYRLAQNQIGLSDAVPAWHAPLPDFSGNSQTYRHPNLDCNRSSGQAVSTRPGSLYVLNDTGLLMSIIVDAKKLSTSAPWPKWQRTAGNSGNIDFERNPGCP